MLFCPGFVANLDPQEFADLLISSVEKMDHDNNKRLLFICCFVQEKNVHLTAEINVI